MNKRPKIVLPDHLQLLKRLEEKGISFRVEGETLWANPPVLLSQVDRTEVARFKPQLMEALHDRQMIHETLLWNAEHAPDHVQCGKLVQETQVAFELGALSNGQAVEVATNIRDRARRVPAYTGTKVVLFRNDEDMKKSFPKRKEWRNMV